MTLTRTVPSPITALVVGSGRGEAALPSALATGGRIDLLARVSRADALRAVDAHQPDVVLVWLTSSWFGGLTLLRKLCATTSAVALLPPEDVRLCAHAARQGATGFLVHGDFTPDELVNAVRAVAAGRVHLSPAAASELVGHVRSSPPEAAHATRLVQGLSTMEQQVLRLLADGLTDVQLGERLELGQAAVQRHLSSLYRKLGVCLRAEAVALYQLTDRHEPPLTTLSTVWRGFQHSG